MIARLRGQIVEMRAGAVVLDVAGVGYLVSCTPQFVLAASTDAEVTMFTTQVVREDSTSLFGFESSDERELFELLLGVSGVGPKSALSVLAMYTPGAIVEALTAENDAVFRKVSGIGPKTAKLIVLQLQGKVPAGLAQHSLPSAPSAAPRESAPDARNSVELGVIEALVGLGYPKVIAEGAVDTAVTELDEDWMLRTDAVPTLLRASLATLRQGR